MKQRIVRAGIVIMGIIFCTQSLTAGKIEITPDNPLILFTDCARVIRASGKVEINRIINAASGYKYDNPGARIRFRTNAKNVSAKLMYTSRHTRKNAVNSKGLYLLNGKIIGSFKRNPGKAKVLVTFPGNTTEKACDYELIMPYGDSVEFSGLSLNDGKLSPIAARPAFKYVAFGDSITHGFYGENVTKTYPFMIGKKLKWQVVNMGFGSRTTIPFDGDAIAQCGGDLISILIGFNDFYRNKTLAKYKQDMKELILQIRKKQATTPVVLITPIWSSEPKWAASKIGLKLEDYRKVVRQIVKESKDSNLHLIEGPSLMDNKRAMTKDGIHPVNKGFAQIAERMTPILKTIQEK